MLVATKCLPPVTPALGKQEGTAMKLKELNYERFRTWLSDAQSLSSSDNVHCFISAWIAFNHYYGTHASEYKEGFSEFTKRRKTGTGDKGQLLFLATQPKFQALLDRFWKESGVAPISIDLPVISELTSRVSPPGLSRGRYRLDVLSAEDLFLALYQIRCNLMHGSKDPRRDARDSKLCQLSASFSVPFLTYLIRHTFGEVLNAYDPDVASKMPVP